MNKTIVYNSFNPDPLHTHQKLLHLVPGNSKVLEIGSSTGYFTKKLISKGCRVVSVEKDINAYKIWKRRIKGEIYNIDAVDIPKKISRKKKFDVLLFADVLEHCQDPRKVLEGALLYLEKNGLVIISVPNIANSVVRAQLFFFGKFEYTEYGILDKTHLHFFTKESVELVFRNLKLSIVNFDVVSGFEVSKVYKKTVGRVIYRVPLLRKIEYNIVKTFPSLFALEFIYVLKKK